MTHPIFQHFATLIQLDKEFFCLGLFVQHALCSLDLVCSSLEALASTCNVKRQLDQVSHQLIAALSEWQQTFLYHINTLIPQKEEYQCVVCLDVMYRPVCLSKCGHT